MGIDLGSLVQTGLGALRTARVRRQEAENQRRILQQSLLAQRLGEAQIAHLTQPPQGTWHFDSERGVLINESTGEVKTPQGLPPGRPKAPVLGTPEYEEAEKRLAGIRTAATAEGKQNVQLTPGERRAAQQVVEALRNMKRLYEKDKTAAQTPTLTAAAEGLSHVPVVGGIASGLVRPAAQRAMTPAQQEFQRNAVTLRHHYASILPHTRVALGLLEDVNKAMVPPPGTDPEAIGAGFAPAWDFTLSQLEPLLGPTGPSPKKIPSPVLSRPNYNPKFWKP